MAEGMGEAGTTITVASGEGDLRVAALAVLAGDDVVVALWGGTRPHVGAVAVAVPRPSRSRPGETSSTSSVLTLVGHKDDVVARAAADRLASALGRTVVVSAGLHVDEADADDVRTLAEGAQQCVDQLLAQLSGGRPRIGQT